MDDAQPPSSQLLQEVEVPTNPIDEPFHTVTDGGGFVTGHPNRVLAEHDVLNRNKEAERLEIKTRYKVVEV